MTRRGFLSNLVASVATLVTAHALPLQKVGRLLEVEKVESFDLASLPHYPAPDRMVAVFYKREVSSVQNGEGKVVRYTIQQA